MAIGRRGRMFLLLPPQPPPSSERKSPSHSSFQSSCDPPCCLAGFWCGHTSWRCKELVSGGVTRGRVARGAREWMTSPKDMTPRVQAQKQPGSRVTPYESSSSSSSSERASSPSSNSSASPKSAASSFHAAIVAQRASVFSMKGEASVQPIARTAFRSI